MDKLYIDELRRKIKDMVKDKTIINHEEQRCYGELSIHFQEGKYTHFSFRLTDK